MADIISLASNRDAAAQNSAPAEELREHHEAFHSFTKLVLFAALHIVLVLVCMALGFVAQMPLLAVMLGLGGTVALIAAFAMSG